MYSNATTQVNGLGAVDWGGIVNTGINTFNQIRTATRKPKTPKPVTPAPGIRQATPVPAPVTRPAPRPASSGTILGMSPTTAAVVGGGLLLLLVMRKEK